MSELTRRSQALIDVPLVPSPPWSICNRAAASVITVGARSPLVCSVSVSSQRSASPRLVIRPRHYQLNRNQQHRRPTRVVLQGLP